MFLSNMIRKWSCQSNANMKKEGEKWTNVDEVIYMESNRKIEKYKFLRNTNFSTFL